MVTLRGASKRLARSSSSAAKSTRTTRTAPIPASSPPVPVETTESLPNLVNLVPNPANLVPNLVPIPVSSGLALQNETFNFDGVQYSPYFLSTSDNPGINLISETLDGNNYNTWSIAMVTALDSNKLAFIDGSLPRPLEAHSYYRIWSRCNSMVKSWILNSVSKEIYGSILRFNDASEIWRDLMVRFHITNLPRSYQLTQQIWSLQQGSTSLSAYYTKLKTLWDNLDGADCVKTFI